MPFDSKESMPLALAGTVTGVCNMDMEMGPMTLQPTIGWVLDFKWDGLTENGIRVYDPNSCHVAFIAMVGISLLGTLIILFNRETYCQQLQD